MKSERYIPRQLDLVAADWATDLDLTGVSGMPPWPPDRLEIHNDETTTQDLVIRGDWASSPAHALEIPADSIRVFTRPVKQIDNSGTGTIATVTAFWLWDGTTALNT